jgi:hypothetical protein
MSAAAGLPTGMLQNPRGGAADIHSVPQFWLICANSSPSAVLSVVEIWVLQ